MGTNALPFLLDQALRGPPRFNLQELMLSRLGRFASWWNPPRSLSRDQISAHAVELVFLCKPRTSTLLPSLLGLLTGTNDDLHLKALRLLSATVDAGHEVIPYLLRDFGSPSFPNFISVEAANVLSAPPESGIGSAGLNRLHGIR